MLFSKLTEKLDVIEGQSSRLAMTASLAELFKVLATDPEEIGITCHLLTGQLLPAYMGLEFGLSEKLTIQTLASLVLDYGGLSGGGVAVDIFGNADDDSVLAEIRKRYKKTGDLGQATGEIIDGLDAISAHQSLTITQVYEQLVTIARANGVGSQDEKKILLKKLLSAVNGRQAKYIVRIILGKMRLGFSLMTLFDGLSWAACGDKSESKFLENLYQQKADVGLLATGYLQRINEPPEKRQPELSKNYNVEIGVPIVPALCQRLNSASEIIEKMTEVIAEPKYDGMRVQIHIQGDQIWAFTRSLENISLMYPELQTLAREIKADNVIFDSEVVGYEPESGKLLAFQDTITRRRKHDIDAKAKDLPARFFIFDVLFLNGKNLLDTPLLKRKDILAQVLPTKSEVSVITPYIITDDDKKLKDYHENLLGDGLEGVVVKQIDSAYQSGRKGWQWVKIKEEEGTKGKLSDTLDLVVMGYYLGRGKRSGFGIGAFLAGIVDEQGNVLSLSKIGTGITDDMFGQLKTLFDNYVAPQMPSRYQVDKILAPDVWLEPKVVVEIAADEITRSSLHTSGFGLRFPRLIKIRTDKTVEEATKTSELSSITIK